MRFRIVSDSDKEAGLKEVMRAKNAGSFEEYFNDRSYNDADLRLGVVLMCRDPRLRFKQRITFSKKDNTLYADVMLDHDSMTLATLPERKRLVGEAILNDIPKAIAKFKFKDFDLPRFVSDLRSWFEINGWISNEH